MNAKIFAIVGDSNFLLSCEVFLAKIERAF